METRGIDFEEIENATRADVEFITGSGLSHV